LVEVTLTRMVQALDCGLDSQLEGPTGAKAGNLHVSAAFRDPQRSLAVLLFALGRITRAAPVAARCVSLVGFLVALLSLRR